MNDPPCREHDHGQHNGHFHQFGCPGTETRDEPEYANGAKHEPGSKHESEIEHASFQNLHDRLVPLSASLVLYSLRTSPCSPTMLSRHPSALGCAAASPRWYSTAPARRGSRARQPARRSDNGPRGRGGPADESHDDRRRSHNDKPPAPAAHVPEGHHREQAIEERGRRRVAARKAVGGEPDGRVRNARAWAVKHVFGEDVEEHTPGHHQHQLDKRIPAAARREDQGEQTKSVHTRLTHSGSTTEPAIVGPPQSVCTNVLWFDLVVVEPTPQASAAQAG